MNYVLAFDVCSFVLLFFLALSLVLRKITKGRANRLFLALLLIVFFSSIIDIVCTIFPYTCMPSYENYFILTICTYLYFILRISAIHVYSLYIFVECTYWQIIRKKLYIKIFWLVLYSFSTLLLLFNMFFNNIFYVSPDLVYHRGEQILLLYLCAILVPVIVLINLVKSRKFISPTKIWVFISLFVFALGGTIIQYFYPHLLLEVFCSTFPMLLISLVIQRPEENVDAETGLLNYFSLKNELTKVFETKASINIIFIQIINFKNLKNKFASKIIKSLLTQLINKFYLLCSSTETEIYYIDEGFFALISSAQNREHFDAVAEGLCMILKENQKVADLEILLESKICVGSCPDDLHDFGTVINFKTNFTNIILEKNEVIYLCDVCASKDFLIRINLDDIIKDAISNHKFVMYYQPIFNVKTKKFTSAEALIRLIDDKYGFVSPGLFIPVAEISGAIHQISDYVFESVFKFISSVDFKKLGLEYIELNLSVAQAIEDNLTQKIEMFMDKYAVSPDKINLEITETAADFNPSIFDRNINSIAQKGISFSLDDYGTGYSNIKRVTQLPLDIIKLDKSFVDEWKLRKMNIIIRESVAMFKKLNKKILVEGVEDEDVAQFFMDLDCDYIQGFYYSKPLPEKDFIDFLYKNNIYTGEDEVTK